jgi:hypothetical protein
LKAAVNEKGLNTGICPLNTNMCIAIPFGVLEIRSVENPVPYNKPIGTSLPSPHVVTRSNPSLNVTRNEELTTEISPNTGTLISYL